MSVGQSSYFRWIVILLISWMAFLVISPTLHHYWQQQQQRELLREAIRRHLAGLDYVGADLWGTPILVQTMVGTRFNVTEARGAGPDRLWDTADDATEEQTDVNHSRQIGKWVGEKSKEAAAGLIEGLRTSSKHDSDH